jgi:hypothetical protein
MLFFSCKLQFFHTGTKDLHLPLDTLPARPTDGVPLFNTVLKVEDTFNHVRFKLVRQFLVLLECDIGQVALLLFCQGDSSSGNVMGLTEGHLSRSAS